MQSPASVRIVTANNGELYALVFDGKIYEFAETMKAATR